MIPPGYRPLEGLRVIDLTQVVSGAVATMLMAEFGADVIKVEPLEGESYRRAGFPLTNGSASTNLNILRFSRGKRSLALNLKTERGHELLANLLADADIVIENFRPGVFARLGFPPDVLTAINPRLIYASVSGFGHDDVMPGPLKDRPAYAIVTEALAGLTDLAGDGSGAPVWMGFAMADIFAGTLALAGTLLALRTRDETGEGQRVDIAMYDGALLMNDLAIALQSVLGKEMDRGQYVLQAPWGPYEASDGYLVIAILTDRQWQLLCEVLGKDDLAHDERLATGYGRASHHDELILPVITAWTCSRTRAEAVEALEAAGLPAAAVRTAAEVLLCPQARARDMLVEVDDPIGGRHKLVGNPIKLGAMSPSGVARVPALGEHTAEILHKELGLTDAQIAELRNDEVVG